MLVRMPFPYTAWQAVHVFPYGKSPFDLDISADGQFVVDSVAGPDADGPACRSCSCAS